MKWQHLIQVEGLGQHHLTAHKSAKYDRTRETKTNKKPVY